MSPTATLLLLYGACLVGAIASPPAPGPQAEPGRPAPKRPPAALLGAVLAVLVALAPAGPARAGDIAPAPVSGPATVIDGATLAVGGQRLRLHGIAAPDLDQTCFDGHERGYPCGRAAADALTARIDGRSVACERLGADDLAAWLVESGYAVADRSASADYAAQDARAWGRRIGLWSGVFELPAQRRSPPGATAGL